MIATSNVVDLINKIKKFEIKIKEQAAIIETQNKQIEAQGAALNNNNAYIARLKSQNADMRLALKRKVVKDADIPPDE